MAKVRNLSDIQQEIAFTEFDFYQQYVETFKTSELGRIQSLLPLREMAISFGLIEEKPKNIRAKRGRKSFFTPESKVALAFLKMYTGLSAPKLMEALNGNIYYQIFCGIRISPKNQLTNYKLIDNILLELSKKLKIQEQQKVLADAWKPYMKNLDTVYGGKTGCCFSSAAIFCARKLCGRKRRYGKARREVGRVSRRGGRTWCTAGVRNVAFGRSGRASKTKKRKLPKAKSAVREFLFIGIRQFD